MNTTALRLEILIIGFQASLWLLLLLYSLEYGLNDIPSKLKDMSVLIIVVLAGWCYSFGAVIDGLTGALEDPKSLFSEKLSQNMGSTVLCLKFPEAFQELNQTHFELRLLRSTAFNLIVFSSIFIYMNFGVLSAIILFTSCVLVGALWYRRRKRVKNRREKLYNKVLELEGLDQI